MQARKYTEIDLSYSTWHRTASIQRFLGSRQAYELSMIDLDATMWIEYNQVSRIPVALIETARDVGQSYKTYTVTRNLAQMAGLPALLCLYKLGNAPNPINRRGEYWLDIQQFRVLRLTPDFTGQWSVLTPQQYAEMLVRMRNFGESLAVRQQLDF
ncbi:MAG TPA: hypothetical protein VIQ31_00880 [Phormidium sp.]